MEGNAPIAVRLCRELRELLNTIDKPSNPSNATHIAVTFTHMDVSRLRRTVESAEEELGL